MDPKPGPDGVLQFTLPMGDARLPGIAAEDIGRCAYGIFQRGDALNGKTVGIVAERLIGTRMAKLGRAFGREVRYNAVTPEEYRAMSQFKHEFEAQFCCARDPALSRQLNPRLQTFAQWLAANAGRIPLDG